MRCKICKKPVRRYDVGAPTGITISIPGADTQDAERRRQIALRALSGEKEKDKIEKKKHFLCRAPQQVRSCAVTVAEYG